MEWSVAVCIGIFMKSVCHCQVGSPWQGVSALWHFVVTHHYTLKHREWSTPMLWIYIPIQPKDQVFATSPIIN